MIKKISVFIVFFIAVFIFTGCSAKMGNDPKRGIVLLPSDIESLGAREVIDIISKADLNVLGIHTNTFSENPAGNGFEDLPSLRRFLESKDGKLLTEECRERNIRLEFETHALQEILPRELFDKHPDYFRMDENGVRQKELNMCFHSEGAYREIEKSLMEIAEWMKPSTHRYFFWTDDKSGSFCHCDLCSQYSESEQALIYENRILEILRKKDPLATVAHLAYHSTLKAPVKVKPEDGVFFEFAPISRDYKEELSSEQVKSLKENLLVFPASSAHILEYWLDASMNSGWDRTNVVKVPWNAQNCRRDLKFYTSLGINSVTCFGTWFINKDYFSRYGSETVQNATSEYGVVLKDFLK